MTRRLALLILALTVSAPIRAVFAQNERDKGRTWIAAFSKPTDTSDATDIISIRVKNGGKSEVIPISAVIAPGWTTKQKAACIAAACNGTKGPNPKNEQPHFRAEVVGDTVAIVGQAPFSVCGVTFANNSSQRTVTFTSLGGGGAGGNDPERNLKATMAVEGTASGFSEEQDPSTIRLGTAAYTAVVNLVPGRSSADILAELVSLLKAHGINAELVGNEIRFPITPKDKNSLRWGSDDAGLTVTSGLEER